LGFFQREEPRITINTDNDICVITIAPLSIADSHEVDKVRERIEEIFKIYMLGSNGSHPITFIVGKYDGNFSDVELIFTFWHWLYAPDEDSRCTRCHNKKEEKKNDFCNNCIDVLKQLKILN